MTDPFAEYAELEREAINTIPAHETARLGLYWWDSAGLDYTATNKHDLIRFHDQMQDGRFALNLALIGELNRDEERLLETAARTIYDFGTKIGKPTAARDALTRAMYQWKTIKRHAPDAISILEIGPGSGYLGLLAMLDGRQYKAIERASGFYHYQRELWSHAGFDDKHMPWWELANPNITAPVDAATINHAICEIHPDGLRVIFDFLRRSTETVVIEDVGLQKTARDVALGIIESVGWHINSIPPVDLHICRREQPQDIRAMFDRIEGAQ